MCRLFSLLVVALVVAAQGCILGCGVEGIHSANPTTVLRVDPIHRQIYFADNKDNDVSIKELIFNPETGEVKIVDLKIINNASKVREANVLQIEALAIQAKAIGEAWLMGLTAGAQLMSAAVPMFGGIQARPPWGAGQPGAVPPGWIYVGPPTTQPVAPSPEGPP